MAGRKSVLEGDDTMDIQEALKWCEDNSAKVIFSTQKRNGYGDKSVRVSIKGSVAEIGAIEGTFIKAVESAKEKANSYRREVMNNG